MDHRRIARTLLVGLFALATAPSLTAQVLKDNGVVTDTPAHDPDEPLSQVEEMPSFPGGKEAMKAYLSENIRYPDVAREQGVEGKVIVAFVVERDGIITNVKDGPGIDGGCKEEAVRVVQHMPKWVPGKQDGKAARVRCYVPVVFNLSRTADTLELACDTVVFGHSYPLKQVAPDGRIIAFGHRDAKGRKTGKWCYLRGEEILRMEGEYHKDVRVGTWWMNDREFFVYDRNGKIMRKGSGMRGGKAIPF